MAFENLEARLRLDADQFQRAASSAGDSMESFGSRAASVGQRMQSVGTKMALGITAPLTAAGALSIRAASDAEEMQSKMGVVFQNLTSDVEAWSRDHADAVGRSSLQLQEYATSLQDTFVPMGFARDEAANMSMQMTELAVDLASFNNMAEDDALQRLQSGLVGNHEALRGFGVMITQARLEQELMNMGIEGGVQAATEQQKAMARLNLIMQDTADAQGDAARTSDSFANQMRSLKARTSELAVAFGKELMPMARRLAGVVSGALRWFEGLSSTQRKIVVVVAALAAALGPLLILFGTLLTMLPMMASGFAMVSAAAAPVTLPILAIAAAVGLLAAAFATDFMGIRSTTQKAVGGILSNLQPLLNLLGPEFMATMRHWKSVISDGLAFVEAAWSRHGEEIMSVVGPLFDIISVMVEGFLDSLITIVRVGLAILRGDFTGAFEILEEFLGRQIDRYKQIGEKLIEALANGITLAGKKAVNAVKDVVAKVRGYLPGSDAQWGPLSDLTASGSALPATFGAGVESNSDAAVSSIEEMSAKVKAAAPSAISGDEWEQMVAKARMKNDPAARGAARAIAAMPTGGTPGRASRSASPSSAGATVAFSTLRRLLEGIAFRIETDDPALEAWVNERAEVVVDDRFAAEERTKQRRRTRGSGVGQ